MSASRFYCPGPLHPRTTLDLPPGAAHHAARVLRLRTGDPVVLFNGEGGECDAEVVTIDKSGVRVRIGALRQRECESPLTVILAQGIAGGEKMDFILQKSVELGISAIQPLETARSVVRLSGERAEKRVQHWQQVVVSACEQCGRNRVPSVAPIARFNDWLGSPGEGARLLLSPVAERRLHDMPAPTGPVTLLIGPEGGLAPEEAEIAQRHGFVGVRLGPRVLRTETAALAALAAMQSLWGDY